MDFSRSYVALSCTAARNGTLAGYIGEAHTLDTSLGVRQPALGTDIRFSRIRYRSESFQPPLYYGVRSGYNFAKCWGAEAELIHLKIFANVAQFSAVSGILNGTPINTQLPVNAIVQRFSLSHGVNLLLANAVFRHAIGRAAAGKLPPAYISLRVGAGTTIPHAESIIQGITDEHYQLGSPAFQLGAGVELRVWRRLHWSGEYKFTRTHEHVDVHSGTAVSLLESHHVVSGPVIHF